MPSEECIVDLPQLSYYVSNDSQSIVVYSAKPISVSEGDSVCNSKPQSVLPACAASEGDIMAISVLDRIFTTFIVRDVCLAKMTVAVAISNKVSAGSSTTERTSTAIFGQHTAVGAPATIVATCLSLSQTESAALAAMAIEAPAATAMTTYADPDAQAIGAGAQVALAKAIAAGAATIVVAAISNITVTGAFAASTAAIIAISIAAIVAVIIAAIIEAQSTAADVMQSIDIPITAGGAAITAGGAAAALTSTISSGVSISIILFSMIAAAIAVDAAIMMATAVSNSASTGSETAKLALLATATKRLCEQHINIFRVTSAKSHIFGSLCYIGFPNEARRIFSQFGILLKRYQERIY